MKIEMNLSVHRPVFSDIKAGECFLFENELYIKTFENNITHEVNAVELATGELAWLGEYDIVTPAKCKVVWDGD